MDTSSERIEEHLHEEEKKQQQQQQQHERNEESTSSRSSSPLPPNDTSVDLIVSSIQTNGANGPVNGDDSPVELNTSIEATTTNSAPHPTEPNHDRNSVTASTLVISSSQIGGGDDMDKSCVDLGVDLKKMTESRDEFVHALNPGHSDTVTNSSNNFLIEIIEQKQIDNQSNEVQEQAAKDAAAANNSDDDNLVKEYEIPNFNGNENVKHQQTSPSSNNDQIEAFTDLNKSEIDAKIEELSQEIESSEKTQEALSKPSKAASPKVVKERKIEDEVYEKPLGNDSLLKKITQYGEEGANANSDTRPRKGQMVTISYETYIKDTQNLVEQNENLSFILGDGDVVPAIDMSVNLMNKNEKCEVIAEARHAYGLLGKQPDIPPNATLLYKLHLKEARDVTNFESMDPVERLSLAESKKLRGNFYFNRQDFNWAISSYRKGLIYFDEENLKGDEEKKDIEKFLELRLALLMNLALSNFKLDQFREALNSLDEVLQVQSKHMKALYIRGKVLMHLGETKQAIESLNKAHELDKNNMEIKKELMKAQAKHKVQYENEKKLYQKMISGVSSNGSSKSEQSKRDSAKKNESSGVLSYLAAGLIVAAASVGIAMFAKYKNLI